MVLLERKKISAPKLAEMFEVTTRTIYRDIETLNLAGIPIVAYPGANGGIGITEQYKIDKKLFTTSDITTLLRGLGSISATLTGDEIVNTLAKIKGLIPTEQIRDIELKSNQIAIDLTPWIGNKNLQPCLEDIKHCLNAKKLLSFKYSDRYGNKSDRVVEPYQLVFKEANWYMKAYCTTKCDYRVFKLSRISQAEILSEEFTPRDFEALPLGKPGNIEKKIVFIKLLIDKELTERILEICDEENLMDHDEKHYLVNFPFVEDDFGYNLLLSFGEKCECLEPPEVRNELIRRIKKMIALY